MYISQHRHTDLFFYCGQYAQAFIHAKAAKGFARTAIGFVVRGFVNEGHAHCGANFLDLPGGIQRHLFGLDYAGTGN